MSKKSSPRWAIGAVVLASLISCSPKAETPIATTSPTTTVEPPSAETTAIKVPPGAVVAPPAPVSEPGYSGVWAAKSADCVDATKAYQLSGGMLKLTPQSRVCSVNSLQEEHPTGRSAIFHITAGCVMDPPTGAAPAGADTVTLTFGASDTVMKMKVNADPEMTLERCPTAPTP
ncbi:MAG: hypothetical protein ABMA14_09520 [Hyphomonadaceae bacterium]